jgi:hypothetical protein
MGMIIPTRHVTWKPCWRIISARYAEEKVFDRVTDPEDRGIIDQHVQPPKPALDVLDEPPDIVRP